MDQLKQVIEPSFWDRLSMFQQEIDPSTLNAIMVQAEQGYLAPLYELYFKIRTTDSRIQGAVASRVLASTRHEWQILSADPDNEQANEAAEFVSDNLHRIQYGKIRKQVMDGILDGVALFENIYTQENGKIELESIRQISQSRIGFERTGFLSREYPKFGQLFVMKGGTRWKAVDSFDYGKLVKAVYLDKPGYYDLTGIMHSTLKWYVIKYYTAKFWSQYTETYGYPVQTIEMTEQDYEKHKSVVEKFLKSVGRNKYGVFFKGMNYQLHETQKAATVDIYKKLIDECNAEMTVSILGQTLTTDVGSSGSRALGDVHQEVRRDLIVSDIEWHDEIATRDICTPLVRFNFPNLPNELYPTFNTMIPKEVNRLSVAQAIKVISSIPGVSIPLSWAYDELNIPMPEGDEAVIEGTRSLLDEIDGSI